jgi:hypothetical protein
VDISHLMIVETFGAITWCMSVAPETKNMPVVVQASCIRRATVWTGHVPDKLTGHRSQFNGIFANEHQGMSSFSQYLA